MWNGNVHWALKYDLETLNQGDIIGCRVREGGRLCFYVNGEYKRYKGQTLANLPVSGPLHGFVELCGDAIRVRALPVVGKDNWQSVLQTMHVNFCIAIRSIRWQRGWIC